MVQCSFNDVWRLAGDQSLYSEYTGGINIVNTPFEEKEFYTMVVTITDEDGCQLTTTLKVTPNNDYLPALYIVSEEWLDYGAMYSDDNSRIVTNFLFAWSTNVNTNNIVVTNSGSIHYSSIGTGTGGITGTISRIASDPLPWHRGCSINIEADFPIFTDLSEVTGSNEPSGFTYLANYSNILASDNSSYNTYKTQVGNGDYSNIDKAANYYSIANTIPNNQVWTARTHLKKNGSVVAATSKAYDFRIQPDAKIAFYITDRINGDASANAILQISSSPWLQKSAYAPDSAYTETVSLDNEYWDGDWQDYDTGDSYVGWFSTNIPCFRTAQDVQDYFDGKIGIDQAINGGDTTFHISSIGDDLSSTDIPTVNLATSGAGCFIYDLSESDIKEIMSNYLYTDDASLKAEYVDALWLWGNNPIDFFIDLYYIPFSITNFYDTVAANLKFGSYQIPDTSYNAVKEANGDRIELFNTSFEGVYGDWRDYTLFTYELFLPYVGFIELDPQVYINKMVSCEMMFDITTHNLRYYLFADGVIADRIDGSVGVNIPLMATDQVNKAKNDRSAYYSKEKNKWNFVGAAAGAVVGGVAAGPTGAVVGGAVGLIGSAINAQINANQLNESIKAQPTEQIYNSFSSSMNIYDISYAYLKITEKGTLIPDKLHTLYGYPCYYMGKASALSGYCELSDIRLSGFTGTIDEANALKTILREGVIL